MSQEKYVALDSEAVEALQQELANLRQRVAGLEHAVLTPSQIAQQQALLAVITKIRESLDLESIFQATATEVRQLLNVDRVGMFRFDPDSNFSDGEFVSEDVLPEFGSALAAKVRDRCFGDNHARYYQNGYVWAASDIYEQGLSDCHLAILSRFQVRANLVVPLHKGNQLWGLLCIHQCSGPRQWQDNEIEFVNQIALHLSVALQQAELLAQAQQRSTELQTTLTAQLQKRAEELALETKRERALAKVIERIRQTLDIETIFQAATQEVRNILKCDRVAVYRFNYAWSGEFVSESVAEGWVSVVDSTTNPLIQKPFLPDFQENQYPVQESFVVDDVYKLLEKFQIRAYCVVPVFVGEKLWGLLGAYQNSGPRQWEPGEIKLLAQIGNQLGVALQQAETMKQLRIQSEQLAKAVEREKAVAAIIDKIRRSLDINTIFQTTVQEVRHLIQADRVAIYRFNPDWSGEFVVESMAEGWVPLLEKQIEYPELQENISECSAKLLANPQIADTYLKETEGGSYTRGEMCRVVDDIYKPGFSDCYIKVLESLQVRAYVIIAIYQGQHLWGLLAAYQNSGPRHWEEADINFLIQIGGQFGVALQQAELLRQAQQKSNVLQTTLETQLRQRADELAEEAERERAIAKVIDKIRQTLDIQTIFQTTATEVRQLLNADRVAMFRFDPDFGYSDGEFVAEDVLPQWISAIAAKVHDHCFGENHAKYYKQGRTWAANDIYEAHLPACHLAILGRFQVRANLVVPLLKGEELWGLLCIHQCSDSRKWQEKEIEFVTHIAVQLGVALQQAELLAQAQKQKEAADAANRAKSDFLAHMSHELRTPLNAILGFSQLMSRDPSLNPEQQENLSIINRSGEHLLTLINDVLEMSKIEAGQTTLSESSFDLYRLLDSLQEMLELKAQEKGLEFILNRSADVPQYISTDESKLRQVLINLLGNAIKFTQMGRVILRVSLVTRYSLLETSKEQSNLLFEVEDTGPGIAKEELGKLFEAFAQTETGRKSQEGTGLGLRISRKFVQLMGGDITVISTLGVGSIFKFNILVEPATVCKIQLPKLERRVLGLKPGQPTYRILVVEDKWANRQLLVNLLVSIGFEVKEATNGEEAIALAETWSPHLLWMDIRMPVMDGYGATKAIKANLAPAPVIIALTANAFEEERLIALSIGCDDFVRKPFQENAILEKMAEHLGVKYIYDELSHEDQTAPVTNDPLPITNLRILLVDDNNFNQKLAVEMLKQLGYPADVASSGTEALEALREKTYDVVLMDVKMPGIDGLETTRRICRRWVLGSRPRIIGMTASTTEGDRQECLAAGMDDYIPKPLRLEELKAALSRCQPVEEQGRNASPISEIPVLNPHALENLRKAAVKDPNSLLRQLIDGYLEDAPKLMQNIREAIEQVNPVQLDLAAHTLKSMSDTFGATTFAQLCKKLELMGESGAIALNPNQLTQLEAQYQQVVAALELERQKLR